MELVSRALMDPPLLEAFRYGQPPAVVVRGGPGRAAAAGPGRGAAAGPAPAPARRPTPPGCRSYPDGYRIEELGTFPRGCPVPHGRTGTRPDGARPTRGFVGRRRPAQPGRLPPGQYDTGRDWPVLTAEVTPHLDPQAWTMTVDGLVEQPRTWTWDEAHALPQSEYAGDIHCVTTWSLLGTRFGGVSVDVLLAAARPAPDAAYVLATCTTGYTTNLPLADLTGGRAWVAGPTRAARCRASTAARCGCWCRTCTSGRAPSG